MPFCNAVISIRHEEQRAFAAQMIYEFMRQDEQSEQSEKKRQDSASATRGHNKMGKPSGTGGGYASSSRGPEWGSGSAGSAQAVWGPRPADAGGWSSQPGNAGGSEERPEEPRQENADCPFWPHIEPQTLKKYGTKLDAKKLGEYIFLYCCDDQCIDCCARSINEYDIDPKSCVSSGKDGLGWAKRNGRVVSPEFARFWEGLTS